MVTATTTSASERAARARAKSDVAALARSPGRASRRDDDDDDDYEFSRRSVFANDDDDEEEDEEAGMTSTRMRARAVIERARAAARAAAAAADALSPTRNGDAATSAATPRARETLAMRPSPRTRSTLGPARRVVARPAPVRAPTERERRDAARRVADSARSVASMSTKGVEQGAAFRAFTNARDRASVDRPRAERTYRRTMERADDESTLRKLLRIAALADERDPPPRRAESGAGLGDVKEAVGFLSSPNKVRAARPRL